MASGCSASDSICFTSTLPTITAFATCATAWADSDPYVEAGVFSKVTVKPYKLVLP